MANGGVVWIQKERCHNGPFCATSRLSIIISIRLLWAAAHVIAWASQLATLFMVSRVARSLFLLGRSSQGQHDRQLLLFSTDQCTDDANWALHLSFTTRTWEARFGSLIHAADLLTLYQL